MLFSRRIIVFLLALALGVLGGMASAAETREDLVQELAHVDRALSAPDSVDPQDHDPLYPPVPHAAPLPRPHQNASPSPSVRDHLRPPLAPPPLLA